MNYPIDPLIFPVSLGLEAQSIARQKAQIYKQNVPKAKQIYLNELAIYAVNFYLECLGFPTDLSASYSQHHFTLALMNTADLKVKQVGHIECIPVHPDAEFMNVSPEVWSDRVAYIAVQISQDLRSANLLGFVTKVTQEKVPLDNLEYLDNLVTYLISQKQPDPICLSQWLQGIIQAGWQNLEELLLPSHTELAFRSKNATNDVQKVKLLDLQRGAEKFALLVGLKPSKLPEFDISVDVYATETKNLPADLKLMILDENGTPVMQTEARGSENVRFKFKGEVGEQFSVRAALGEFSITEAFVI